MATFPDFKKVRIRQRQTEQTVLPLLYGLDQRVVDPWHAVVLLRRDTHRAEPDRVIKYATSLLAACLAHGTGINRNPHEAWSLWAMDREHDPYARFCMANRYLTGDRELGLLQDTEAAQALYQSALPQLNEMALVNGDVRAQYWLGYSFARMSAVWPLEDYALQARDMLARAGRQQHAQAQADLGTIYLQHAQDPLTTVLARPVLADKGTYLLEASAKQGCADAFHPLILSQLSAAPVDFDGVSKIVKGWRDCVTPVD